MPTLQMIEGYRFCFFSEEGEEPPDIHVKKGDASPAGSCGEFGS